LAGSTFLSLIPEADQKTVMTNISALTLNSPTQSHEHSVIGQSGDIRWQRWTNRALFDEQGKVVGYQSIGEDITERKYAEEALKESEELHRITLSNISDAVFMTDDAGNFTYICPNVNAIFGYTYEEVFAFENIEKLLGANLFDGSELEASKELRNIEAEVRDKSGSMHSLLVSVKRVSIKGGTLLYTCRDITERKQAEEALKERENFLGTLVDAIPIPVFYKDRDGRYIGVNAAFEAFFGETREKLIDKTVFDINPPELAAIYHAKDKELFESKGIQRYEAQVRNAKGVLRDVIFNKSVFTDRTGITTGIIGAILDITERKLAEKSLQDSEARLKALSDASFEAIFFSDKGVCLDQNQTAERMFGYTHDEAIGRLATEWIIPEDQELVMEMVRSRREEPYEVTALCKNGKAFPCEIQGRMFDYGGRSIRVTSLRDITQRKQAEQALKKSEERFRRIFEDIILGIFQFTADGRIINVNPAFSKMFGYASPEHIVEAIGDSASQLYVHPGDHKRLIRQISNSEVPLEAEVNFNRNDGSNFVGNFHGWKVMDTKYDTFFLEGFIEDITERKSAEDSLRESHKRLQFLSARLLNSQENEQRRISLEIHDDMGQDLALLKMHLITIAGRLWKDQLKLKDDISRTLVLIDGIIEKARNLSRDLNPDIIEDLKLSGALDWLINEIEKHVAIRISLELESVDHLFSTEHQIVIYRIIQEALKNIVKHAKAETAAVKIEKHKNCVMLKIEDDGKGFDISSVWEKHVADRGLGLAAMDERSRILGGVLDMRSKSGHGTCITLRIPIRRETDGK
jgi:PAS domain S-box-containing protein